MNVSIDNNRTNTSVCLETICQNEQLRVPLYGLFKVLVFPYINVIV